MTYLVDDDQPVSHFSRLTKLKTKINQDTAHVSLYFDGVIVEDIECYIKYINIKKTILIDLNDYLNGDISDEDIIRELVYAKIEYIVEYEDRVISDESDFYVEKIRKSIDDAYDEYQEQFNYTTKPSGMRHH